MKTIKQIKNYFESQIIFENLIDFGDFDNINIDLFFSNTQNINYLKSYLNENNLNKGLVFNGYIKNPLLFYKNEILNFKPVIIIIDNIVYSEINKNQIYFTDLINEFNKNNIKLIAINNLELDKFFKFFYDLNINDLNIYGITGTNGKTSITTILYHISNSLSNYDNVFSSSLIGTIKYCVRDKVVSKYDVNNSLLTTPDTSLIYYLIYLSKINKVRNIFMEVSSHSLDQQRPKGLYFKIASFTNLTIDHLDYHKTMENYFNAKRRLFFEYPNDFTVINSYYNDYGKILYNQLKDIKKNNIFTYIIKDYTFEINGTNFVLNIYKDDKLIEINGLKDIYFFTNLIGVFNIHNLAISFINFYIMNKEIFEINYIDFFKDYIKNINFLEGRLELVNNDPIVFIDYAHTPDALENVIKTLIEYKESLKLGNIYVVFGAGGNRDKTKRPIMGSIVSSLADKIIITSDNPRDEDPLEIINDILKGIKNKNNVIIEPDREKAIIKALNDMKLNDILLIAGKGHENYQIIGNKRIFFSDKEIVKCYFNKIKLKKG
ncbi:MAG: UDP-N-acetylmuramoyl-L-alanyl-D-glutamate--2,6-diaminopimelate ligase [bacterium]|nr:UDP-N-acetylmuramoyl-L-alanyl-D-glutamate--2,6-diaminopimelate ligase [bacterium]